MKYPFSFIFLIGLLLTGCRKEGNTLPELSGTKYLENQSLFYCPECFSIINQYNVGFVIRDNNSYISFANSLNSHAKYVLLNVDCDTATVIPIDFSKYTLIAVFTTYGACDIISRKIQSDTTKKNIVYTISIKKYHGECVYVLLTSMNLSLIPKLPDGWNVVFDIKNE